MNDDKIEKLNNNLIFNISIINFVKKTCLNRASLMLQRQ